MYVTRFDAPLGRIRPTLCSSNKEETASLIVALPGRGLEEAHLVRFDSPMFSLAFAESGPFLVGVERAFSASYTFHGFPAVGHSLGVSVYEVQLEDGTTITGTEGTNQTEALASNLSLKNCVSVNDGSWLSYLWYGYGAYVGSTPNAATAIQAAVVNRDGRVTNFSIGYVDLSIGEE